MSGRTVRLSPTIEVHVSEIVLVSLRIKDLLARGKLQVLRELKAKAENNEVQLSRHAVSMLGAFSLVHADGSVRPDFLAIVNRVLKVNDAEDTVTFVDLVLKPEERLGLKPAIDSLTTDEVMALALGCAEEFVSLEDGIGYQKVAHFCRDGIPTPELVNALLNEVPERMK